MSSIIGSKLSGTKSIVNIIALKHEFKIKFIQTENLLMPLKYC
jgi:hypothetical protein